MKSQSQKSILCINVNKITFLRKIARFFHIYTDKIIISRVY